MKNLIDIYLKSIKRRIQYIRIIYSVFFSRSINMNVRNVNNSKNKTIQLDYSLKTQISAEKKNKK